MAADPCVGSTNTSGIAMKTHGLTRPSCRGAAENRPFRGVEIARSETCSLSSADSADLAPEIAELSLPNKRCGGKNRRCFNFTKGSKRGVVSLVLALLFVVGAGSGFAWGIAELMMLLNRALPVVVESQAEPWVRP